MLVVFDLCRLLGRVGSVVYRLGENGQHHAIHSARTLETAWCTACHSRRKRQYILSLGYRTEQRIRKEMDVSNGDYEGVWSLVIETLYFNLSSCSAWDTTLRCLVKGMPWGKIADAGKIMVTGICTMPHQQENAFIAVRKFL